MILDALRFMGDCISKLASTEHNMLSFIDLVRAHTYFAPPIHH